MVFVAFESHNMYSHMDLQKAINISGDLAVEIKIIYLSLTNMFMRFETIFTWIWIERAPS